MNEQLETDAAMLRKAPDGALPGGPLQPNVTLDKGRRRQITGRGRACGNGRYPVLVVLPKDFDFEVDAMLARPLSGQGHGAMHLCRGMGCRVGAGGAVGGDVPVLPTAVPRAGVPVGGGCLGDGSRKVLNSGPLCQARRRSGGRRQSSLPKFQPR